MCAIEPVHGLTLGWRSLHRLQIGRLYGMQKAWKWGILTRPTSIFLETNVRVFLRCHVGGRALVWEHCLVPMMFRSCIPSLCCKYWKEPLKRLLSRVWYKSLKSKLNDIKPYIEIIEQFDFALKATADFWDRAVTSDENGEVELSTLVLWLSYKRREREWERECHEKWVHYSIRLNRFSVNDLEHW